MKPSLRLAKVLLTAKRRGQVAPMEDAITRWRVLPTDIDVFGHMNNSRYAQLMDYARLDYLIRMGLLPAVLKGRWTTPLGMVQMDFRQSLKPNQEFEIATRTVSYDDRWMYIMQTFRTVSEPVKTVATGYVKLMFREGNRTVPPRTIVRIAAGEEMEPPALSDELRARFGFLEPAGATNGAGAREPVAIVGIGCRLPGGLTDADSLWDALVDGRDCVVDIPGSRWDPQRYFDPTGRARGRSYVHRAGMLTDDPRGFDAAFFGIPPREAALLDPQQRLLLQCTWEAFEDAGEPPADHVGARTGVFIGGFMADHFTIHSDPVNRERLGTHSATAGTHTMLSNRISYQFDLRGPSVSVDTACSSSLVAIHQACQSIWAGETDAALAGGVNVILSPETHVTMAKGRFLSKTGRCQAFSAAADGYVRAEGAAVLLLKPLSAARRDGNTIHAVVLGSAANQDGRTNGISVPNGEAQVEVMRVAYAQAGVRPADVCYVEAHGTGTPVGDPIEAGAIGEVVGAGRVNQPCPIGSIKTNFGHLEAAAGVAGVIKAALCLKNGVVPPHLHLAEVNPAIDLDALSLEIPTQATPLARLRGRRVAGVNSFGYGGTNAHVVLAEPPVDDVTSAVGVSEDQVQDARSPVPVLALSARSPEALGALAARHAEALEGANLIDRCRSTAVNRNHHRFRRAFSADNSAALLSSLRAFTEDSDTRIEPAVDGGKLLFVYTGMGPQWWAMGRQLWNTEIVFRDAVEECDAVWHSISGSSILAEMLADEPLSRMDRTDVAQPANAVLQIGLTELWRSWGVVPDGVLGHSVGELGAAYASKALTLKDTLRVAYHRSRLQARLAGSGSMLAVGLDPIEATAYAARFDASVSVAAINSANSVTLAGDSDALQVIAGELTETGIFHRFLQVEVPYHSPLMEGIHDELIEELHDLDAVRPMIDVYSTAYGARMVNTRHDADYWWQNVRGTVLFADALRLAIDDGHNVFLEVGPHPVLAPAIRDVIGDAGATGVGVTSLTRGADESATMRTALRALYAAGAPIDWRTYFGPGAYTGAPKYPWRNEMLWDESDTSMHRRIAHDRHPMIFEAAAGAPQRLTAELSFAALPYLEDHHVAGTVLFPGAGYVELALAARHLLTDSAACSIEDLEFTTAVPLEAETATRAMVSIAADSQVLTISAARGDAEPVPCARAKVYSIGRPAVPVDIDALRLRLPELVPADLLYESLATRGLRYGRRFQAVRSLHRGTNEVCAEIALPDDVHTEGYHLHPVLLDAAFHSLLAAASDGRRGDLVPVGVDRIQFFGTPDSLGGVLYSHGRLITADVTGIRGDLTLFTGDGTVIAEVTGFTCRLLPPSAHSELSQEHRYARRWEAFEAVAPVGADWIIVDDTDRPLSLKAITARVEPVSLIDLRWSADAGESENPVSDGAAAASRLVETVRSLPPGQVARYVLVTCRAEQLDGDPHAPAIDRAVLLGLARTVMSEFPELAVTLIDLDEPFADDDDLIALIERVGGEQEIALRKGKLFCARIDRARALERVADERVTAPVVPGSAYVIEVPGAGGLELIGFTECERPDPADDEVEIEVALAPLNFKDVLKAMGLLSDRAKQDTRSGNGIGMELAGRISRVGRGVTDFQVGQRVYAMVPDAVRSHAIVKSRWVIGLPDSISFEVSAGITAMLTAYHGLVKIARLQPGETVLVHGGTGGVGLAAIEIAKWIGAEIIATAGSEEKRDYLRSLGIHRVSASRDVSFADDVASWTDGRGVDVVLNFSPGELMLKSVACLAPFGRFIEIGKVSFDQDAPLGLRPFNENLTYASVDFDRMMASRPGYVSSLGLEILALIDAGVLGTVPVTVFPASRVPDAFRLMARSRHMGKVVVAIADSKLEIRERAQPAIRSDATYLVTGGLGGFGLETARWLVAKGARHLALVSRRGLGTPGAPEVVRQLEVLGAHVGVFTADVGSAADVAAVVDRITATMPELRGVIHSAAVLDDRPIAALEGESLDRVLGPKAQGAWNLHTLTGVLDFFVMYSSISSLIGNPGQGNYVAANAALDALAMLRRVHGLPASVIQWGVLGEAGMVARDAGVAAHLEQLGLRPLSIDDALSALGEVIDGDVASVAIVDADWARLGSALAPTGGNRRLTSLATQDASPAKMLSARAMELFSIGSDEDRRGRVEEMVAQVVARVMEMEAASLDLSQPLHQLGMDSIMGLEIATGIEMEFGLRISAVELASGPPIVQLAATVLDRLDGLMSQEQTAPIS